MPSINSIFVFHFMTLFISQAKSAESSGPLVSSLTIISRNLLRMYCGKPLIVTIGIDGLDRNKNSAFQSRNRNAMLAV